MPLPSHGHEKAFRRYEYKGSKIILEFHFYWQLLVALRTSLIFTPEWQWELWLGVFTEQSGGTADAAEKEVNSTQQLPNTCSSEPLPLLITVPSLSSFSCYCCFYHILFSLCFPVLCTSVVVPLYSTNCFLCSVAKKLHSLMQSWCVVPLIYFTSIITNSHLFLPR